MLTETLGNGLRTSVLERKGLESVGIGFCVNYGELSDPMRLMGLAHFLEHMLFVGTKKRISGGKLKAELLRRGVGWNGETHFDSTWYELYCHKSLFEKTLDIMSDITLNSTLEEEAVETERKTIMSEIAKWTGNPIAAIYNALPASLFQSERFDYLAQGTNETLQRITRSDLRKVYSENYGARNSFLAVYGAVEENKAQKLVEEMFSSHSGGSRGNEVSVKRRTAGKDIVIKQEGMREATLALAFDTTKYSGVTNAEKVAAADVVADMLSNRLRMELRETRGLAYNMEATHMKFASFSYIECTAGVREVDVKRAKEIMLDVCEKISRGEMNKKETEESKAGMLISRRLSFERSLSMAKDRSYYGLLGAPNFISSYIRALKEVSLDDVRKAASECIDTCKCGTVSFLPKASK